MFALPLEAVDRVVRAVEVTRLPEAPAVVRGVINLQGRIICVIDLRRRCGLPARDVDPVDQFVIAHTSSRTVALWVDAATVAECPREAVTPARSLLPGLDYARGLVEHEGRLVVLFEPDVLLSVEDGGAIDLAMAGLLSPDAVTRPSRMTAPLPPLLLEGLSVLVAERTGLLFAAAPRADLERGIRTAAADFGFEDVAACAEWLLSSQPSRRQVEVLASHLTIGETYFFREGAAFQALEGQILPELIRARRGAGPRRLRLWSAGCCSGEEAYSLAIAVARVLPDWKEWDVLILATDINPRFLRKAREGVFGEWSFRSTPAAVREFFFTRTADNRSRVLADLKRMVRFAHLNLAVDEYPSPSNDTEGMDVVLCRNVLIYLGPEHVARVIRGLSNCLTESGQLFVGAAEGSLASAEMETVGYSGVTGYRRRSAAPREKAGHVSGSAVAFEGSDQAGAKAAVRAVPDISGAADSLWPPVSEPPVAPAAGTVAGPRAKVPARHRAGMTGGLTPAPSPTPECFTAGGCTGKRPTGWSPSAPPCRAGKAGRQGAGRSRRRCCWPAVVPTSETTPALCNGATRPSPRPGSTPGCTTCAPPSSRSWGKPHRPSYRSGGRFTWTRSSSWATSRSDTSPGVKAIPRRAEQHMRQALSLLSRLRADDVVPESEGLTAGGLADLIAPRRRGREGDGYMTAEGTPTPPPHSPPPGAGLSERHGTEPPAAAARIARPDEADPAARAKAELLKARARDLARKPKEDGAAGAELEVVEFLLADERYGIASTFVREVYPLHELTPLPCTPPFVLGIINVRGQVLAVLDLRKFFDLPFRGITDLNKVIILEAHSTRMGVLADRIFGVRSVPLEQLQPSLPTLTGVRAEYLRGVTAERLIVLDADRILADEGLVVDERVEA